VTTVRIAWCIVSALAGWLFGTVLVYVFGR
jgi:hypothetical protein